MNVHEFAGGMLISFAFGGLIIFALTDYWWKKYLVRAGYAHYDQTTGIWKLGEKP